MIGTDEEYDEKLQPKEKHRKEVEEEQRKQEVEREILKREECTLIKFGSGIPIQEGENGLRINGGNFNLSKIYYSYYQDNPPSLVLIKTSSEYTDSGYRYFTSTIIFNIDRRIAVKKQYSHSIPIASIFLKMWRNCVADIAKRPINGSNQLAVEYLYYKIHNKATATLYSLKISQYIQSKQQ